MKLQDQIQPQPSIMKQELEEQLHQLRSKATELLLREDWPQYINLYSNFISHYNHQLIEDPSLHKPLSLALSNRAEARYKLRDLPSAVIDCNEALQIDPTHQKTLICKGKVLLDLGRYAQACECFHRALLVKKTEGVVELVERCKKLDSLSRTGVLDLSEWLVNGFNGAPPELAEFVGAVEIREGDNGRRGMFVTKSIEAGTLLVITKAVVIGRGILPETDDGSSSKARMVMWKDFVDRILDAADRCSRTLYMIYMLSTGAEDDEGGLKIPDMVLFRPETDDERFRLENTEPDVERILKVLDVNCINEDAVSSRVWGKKTSGLCCGVGLWILPSFVNHSCCPNVRRLHIGDWLVMHASRDLKEGEEVTFAYFDPLLPLGERRGLSKRWGFVCDCQRCKFEEEEEDLGREEYVLCEFGELVMRLEEQMKKKGIGKKEKGFLRASLWSVYAGLYETEKMRRRLGRKIPTEMVVAESVMEAVGGDDRVLRAALGSLRKNGGGASGGGGGRWVEIEKLMKMVRGVYGKVMKKQGMRALFDQLN